MYNYKVYQRWNMQNWTEERELNLVWHTVEKKSNGVGRCKLKIIEIKRKYIT
jgi:hypothetical protein